MVVLPDHLHSIWTLPRDDARFSMRWSGIKGAFSRWYPAAGGAETGLSASRRRRGERGI
jgi:putative transposase